MSYINSATCYTNLTTLFGNDATAASTFQKQVLSAVDSSASLVPSKDSGVIAGFKAIYTATADKFLNSPLGHVEFLLYATGAAGANPQNIAIQVALQHPFSHGRLYISTNNSFDPPTIDPQYFSNPAGMHTILASNACAEIWSRPHHIPPRAETSSSDRTDGSTQPSFDSRSYSRPERQQ